MYLFNLKGSYNMGLGIACLWHDGTYLYVGTSSGVGSELRKLTFDGTNFTSVADVNVGASVYCLTGDGTYLYRSEYTGFGLFAINKTTLANITSINIPAGSARSISCSPSGYIYVGSTSGRVYAYTFDGVNFQLRGTLAFGGVAPETRLIITDGTYIYVLWRNDAGSYLSAYTFDGVAFTHVASTADITSPGTERPTSLCTDGTHFFVGHGGAANPDMRSFTFNGAAWTAVQTGNVLGGTAYGMTTDGQFIYVQEQATRIGVYTHTPAGGFVFAYQYIDASAGASTFSANVVKSGAYVFYMSGNFVRAIRLDLSASFTVDILNGDISQVRTFTAT